MSDKEKPKKGRIRRVYDYSSLGLQMAAIIGIGSWFGSWLDEKYHTEKNWLTLVFVLMSVGLSMYYTVKKLNQLNDRY